MIDYGRVAIGFDVGTGSVKATALTESGTVFTASSPSYGTARPFEGAAEQDPDNWWDAVLEAGSTLLSAMDDAGVVVNPATAIIGLTGQMHTSVFLGESDRIVHPSILWSDKRALDECAKLRDSPSDYPEITGNAPMPAFTVTHLMWLQRHRPEVFGRVRAVLNPKDDIRRRLGAGRSTEPADASGTGIFDTRTGQWSDAVAQAAGIDVGLFAPVLPSHATTGVVTDPKDASSHPLVERLAGIPVIGGGGDQATQAVALGVDEPGALGLSLGTSGVAFMARSEPRLGSFRHAYEQRWLSLDSTHSAGLSMSWIARILGSDVADLSHAAGGPVGAPVFLPYLQGQRDAGERGEIPGSFVGLEAKHQREDLVYAVMEGVAIELRRLAANVGAGVDIGDPYVHLGGGGGRSERWREVIASVFDRPVRYLDRDSAFGAAALAAESAGWLSQFHQRNRDQEEVTEPNNELRDVMAERVGRFADLSAQLQAG